MSRLSKLRGRFRRSTSSRVFSEASVNRDEEGKFAPKDAAKQIAKKVRGRKKATVRDEDKDLDVLAEEIFQERFKRFKEDGSYKYILLGTGQKYDEILKEQGQEAADKAYEDFIRKASLGIAKELKRKAVIEADREAITKGKDKIVKRELKAFDRFYPQHRYTMTLQEFKQNNPDVDLLSRLDAEEKLDKQLSYESMMKRGERYTRRLDTKLARVAYKPEKQLKVMEDYRAELLAGGMSSEEASRLASAKQFDASIKWNFDREDIKTAASEFYQITRGAGNSTLEVFKNDAFRAYASYEDKAINVGNFVRPDAVFHEMGHHIEFEDRRIAQAAREWRDKRATGDARLMNDLVQGGGYGSDEIAKPGNYFHPYVGKVYRSGWTEVISMGVEKFYSAQSMLELYEQDREHFQFIVGVIRRD